MMLRVASLFLLLLHQAGGGCKGEQRQLDIAARLENGPSRVAGEALRHEADLKRFYADNDARAWSRERATALLAALSKAADHGLAPKTYRVGAIARALGDPSFDLVELDILLADSYLSYATHLAFGRLDPGTLEHDWRARRRDVDLVKSLARVAGGDDVDGVLKSLAPRAPEYRALKAALVRYRSMQWKRVSKPLASLRESSQGPAVLELTSRLVAEGYLDTSGDKFTGDVTEAVRRFQRHHGLPETGVVATQTIAALNVTAEERARQIELNLERWRWLPETLGQRHIRVNIPNFSLAVFEDGRRRWAMEVIVGKAYRRTPIFSGAVTSVVFNPTWGIPRRIAVEDKLPAIQKDPTYLSRKGIAVYRGTKQVEPEDVDWSKLSDKSFPYQLRQAAGPDNPLGQLKFDIKNDFAVYLHDTNERDLFKRRDRSLSSGCIRLAEPRKLAEFVLGPMGWKAATIDASIASTKTQRIRADGGVMLHLLYFTAWAGDGPVHFRADIDGRDKRLSRALARLVAAAN